MRIGELATKTGVSIRSLRYYEDQGLLAPARTGSGQRVYDESAPAAVAQIRALLDAGFCSSVIRELLPSLTSPTPDAARLRDAFDAAAHRLEDEKRAIDTELAALARLREDLDLDPDTHVRAHSGRHDTHPASAPAAFDHRDRRLR